MHNVLLFVLLLIRWMSEISLQILILQQLLDWRMCGIYVLQYRISWSLRTKWYSKLSEQHYTQSNGELCTGGGCRVDGNIRMARWVYCKTYIFSSLWQDINKLLFHSLWSSSSGNIYRVAAAGSSVPFSAFALCGVVAGTFSWGYSLILMTTMMMDDTFNVY